MYWQSTCAKSKWAARGGVLQGQQVCLALQTYVLQGAHNNC